MNSFHARTILLVLLISCGLAATAGADAPKIYSGSNCTGPVDDFFVNEVWAKVAADNCLKCHKDGGDAEDSKLVLLDLKRVPAGEQENAIRQNWGAFLAMARKKVENQPGEPSRLLQKVVGNLKHGGEEVLKPDSAGYRVLAEFVRRSTSNSPEAIAQAVAADKNAPPFFDGIVMMEDRSLLRRVTLSLAGRLPTEAELAAVAKDGRRAMPALLDAVMKEEAFYTRLREGFNDIFLTVGITDNAEATVLSYEHFSTTRLWYQKHDLSAAGDAKAQTQARYKLANDYRVSLLAEPMKLVEHIVRNDKPFTEIVTADYIMVSPYSARGYGIYDTVRDQFKNPDDPTEFIPVKLKALKARTKNDDQDSATGFYPHAGLLSSFQYLRRYPTTETNRNRLRARMYFEHFLGIDLLELAARVSDAAAVTAQFKNPTMEASQCVVCHRTMDPVAGLFQDYWKFEGVYGKRKGGWFTDMFGPGFEGEEMPSEDRWRALQWLGERTAKDPRFATAMVGHAYYILTGRKVLLPPKDLEHPLFTARHRAYREQQKQINAIAAQFSQSNFNFKKVLEAWILSDFYRADGLATADVNPQRHAELDDLGLVRMLSPEQIERKTAAIFGQRWGKLNEQLAMLYGGIDSQEVTERAADPSGAMGAIQRIMANDVACRQTAMDFSRKPNERVLFPNIEPDVVPGASPEQDEKIRQAMVHLHERILGKSESPNSPQVNRSFRLFADIVADAAERKLDPNECYTCRQKLLQPVPDPKYTVRAWRAVVTYLLRQHEFLYE